MKNFPVAIPIAQNSYSTPPDLLDTHGGVGTDRYFFYSERWRDLADYLALGDQVTFTDPDTGIVYDGRVSGIYPFIFTVTYLVGPDHTALHRSFQLYDYLTGFVYKTHPNYA